MVSGCQFINALLWILNVRAVLKNPLCLNLCPEPIPFPLLPRPHEEYGLTYQSVPFILQILTRSVTSFFTLMKLCHPLHPNKVCVVRSPNKLWLVAFPTFFQVFVSTPPPPPPPFCTLACSQFCSRFSTYTLMYKYFKLNAFSFGLLATPPPPH